MSDEVRTAAGVELLPCPFCGKTDRLAIDMLGSLNGWYVDCDRCHIGSHAIFRCKEATVKAWNTRSADAARIAELEAQQKSSDESLAAQEKKYADCPHPKGEQYWPCGCSYDKPSDVCAIHAPQLREALMRIATLEREAACPCCKKGIDRDGEPCRECKASGYVIVAYECQRYRIAMLEGLLREWKTYLHRNPTLDELNLCKRTHAALGGTHGA